MTEKTKKAFHF